jgi:acyl dehydratase
MPSIPIETLQERVGRAKVTVEGFLVEAGKVAEFAEATLNNNPVHRNGTEARRRGFDAVPAPLTFTATKRFARYRPAGIVDHWGFDLGFDQDATVHGQKEYDFERTVLVGDELTAETTLERVYQREGQRGGEMTFAVLATVFTDSDDRRVLTERSTLIETAGTGSEAE